MNNIILKVIQQFLMAHYAWRLNHDIFLYLFYKIINLLFFFIVTKMLEYISYSVFRVINVTN